MCLRGLGKRLQQDVAGLADPASDDYDLRVQRNVMVGVTGGLTLAGIIVSVVYLVFGN